MLSITRLREFLVEAKNQISSINYTNMVVDDSQLVSLLRERETEENNMLIGIVPQFNLQGTEDQAKWNNQLLFQVLAKSSRGQLSLDDQVDLLESTRVTTKDLVEYMIGEKTGDNGELCGMTNELVESSIMVTPIWEKAQCCGWMIQIDLLTRV